MTNYKTSVLNRHMVNRPRRYNCYTSQLAGQPSSCVVQRSSSTFSSSSQIMGTCGIPMKPPIDEIDSVRINEKRELGQLNDKFANYVEKVRFLEAQNKKLSFELETAQKLTSSGQSIREMFDAEENALNEAIEHGRREMREIEFNSQSMASECDNLRNKLEEAKNKRTEAANNLSSLSNQIARNESELSLLKRRLEDIQHEKQMYRQEIDKVVKRMDQLQSDIQGEVFTKSCMEAERIAIEQEVEMLNHDRQRRLQEFNDQIDSMFQNSATSVFKGELATAIREIRTDYERGVEEQKALLHNKYIRHCNEMVMKSRPLLPRTQGRTIEKTTTIERTRENLDSVLTEQTKFKSQIQELKFRISEIRAAIERENEQFEHATSANAQTIDELKLKIQLKQKELDEANSCNVSMKEEISKYRDLLEGKEGLGPLMDRVEKMQIDRQLKNKAEIVALDESSNTHSVTFTSHSTMYGTN